MANYGNFNLNKKRKGKKIIVAVVSVIICLAAIVFFIGITVGSDGTEMEHVSSVVEENTYLKMQISELNDAVARMQKEIDDLTAQLASMPTPVPTQYGMPDGTEQPTETPRGNISPRGSLRQ